MTPLLAPMMWSQVMHLLGVLPFTHAHRLLGTCARMHHSKEVAKLLQVVVHSSLWPGEHTMPAWLLRSRHITLELKDSTHTEAIMRALPMLHAFRTHQQCPWRVSNGCIILRSLGTRYCDQRTITDAAFLALAKGSPGLRSLAMRGCKQNTIPDAAFVALATLATDCPMLRSLDMSDCTQRTITDAASAALATRPDITVRR